MFIPLLHIAIANVMAVYIFLESTLDLHEEKYFVSSYMHACMHRIYSYIAM